MDPEDLVVDSQYTQIQATLEARTDEIKKSLGRIIPTREKDIDKVVDIIEGEKYLFGRNKESYVIFDDIHVSKAHCQIWYDSTDGEVKIWDNSANGTFINGRKMQRGATTTLTDGDRINLAKESAGILFRFESYIHRKNSDEYVGQLLKVGYDLKDFLGKGAFSIVHKGVQLSNGKVYAIKIIDKRKSSDNPTNNHIEKSLIREIEIVKTLSHPNIVNYVDYVDCPNSFCLILEFVPGGELFARLSKYGPFEEEEAKFFFVQILSAVDYLHQRGIAHRDLKPENILLDGRSIKLTDFGLARKTQNQLSMKTLCGTPHYVAPEILNIVDSESLQDGYTTAIDIWSLGVILYAMLTGTLPFCENKNLHLYTQIKTASYEYPQYPIVSELAKDLISKMLLIRPENRIPASMALKHPWFDSLKKRKISPLKNDNHEFNTLAVSNKKSKTEEMIPDENKNIINSVIMN